MESVTELAAFTATARSYVAPVPIPRELGVVDLPSYAGKQETFHALAAAAIVAASAGAAILMHGYDGIPGRAGNAGVLKALGLPIDMEPKVAAEAVKRHGFAYLDIALYHPPIYRFLEMRQELGVRNVFHPVARLLNPARAASQVIGLSHPPHFEKTAEVLRMLGCPRALVISGVEGDPELSIAAAHKGSGIARRADYAPFVLAKGCRVAAGHARATWPGFPSNQREKEADLLRRILHNQIQGGPKLGVDECGVDAVCRRQRDYMGVMRPTCTSSARRGGGGTKAGRTGSGAGGLRSDRPNALTTREDRVRETSSSIGRPKRLHSSRSL